MIATGAPARRTAARRRGPRVCCRAGARRACSRSQPSPRSSAPSRLTRADSACCFRATAGIDALGVLFNSDIFPGRATCRSETLDSTAPVLRRRACAAPDARATPGRPRTADVKARRAARGRDDVVARGRALLRPVDHKSGIRSRPASRRGHPGGQLSGPDRRLSSPGAGGGGGSLPRESCRPPRAPPCAQRRGPEARGWGPAPVTNDLGKSARFSSASPRPA